MFTGVFKSFSPTSEVGGSNPGSYVGKLVVAYQRSAVYSTELWPTVCTGFLCPINYSSWYDMYSVESDVKTQINKLNHSQNSTCFLSFHKFCELSLNLQIFISKVLQIVYNL